MADSPFEIVFQMIQVLVTNTVSTLIRIVELFGSLVSSLGVASETGGPIVFIGSIALVSVVGFFIAKIVFGGGKRLLILIPLGIILFYLIILGIIA